MNEEHDIEETKKLDFYLLRRLLHFMKPFITYIVLSVIVIFVITGIELIKPIIIGQAIDKFINGYKYPYMITDEKSRDTILFNGVNLIKAKNEEIGAKNNLAQIIYNSNKYFIFIYVNKEQSDFLNKNSGSFKQQNGSLPVKMNNIELSGKLLSENDLKVIRKSDFSGILFFSGIFLFVLICGFIFNYLQVILLQFTGQKILYNIRSAVFTHIENLPLSFFDKNPVGRIVTRITNDTETLNEMYTSVIVNLSRNALLVIGILVVLLFTNAVLALIAFSVIPLIIIFTLIFRNLARSNYRVIRKVLAVLNSFLSENISGMKMIQLFNVQKKKYDEFDKVSTDLNKAYLFEILIFGVFRPTMFLLYIIALCLTIVFGGMNVVNNVMSFGTLFVFFMYLGRFFDPIIELAEQFNILQSAMASSERIFNLLDEKTVINDSDDAVELSEFKQKIEFKNVWFAYNEENWVLKNVSFEIDFGNSIALVGSTGSGKTTIINLIARYYEIQKGQILIDGIDIKKIKIESLRKLVGHVMQDVFLFTGTIESNIKLRNDDLLDNEMVEFSQYVNADKFIDKFSDKYKHPVSERGSTLSTGQRQLLSFARALIFKPQILVLDEATSSIDTETEELIQDALSKMIAGRTSIVIAHRLSTIKHSNKIIVLHKGEIKETGNHNELLEKKGIYYNLYMLNFGVEK